MLFTQAATIQGNRTIWLSRNSVGLKCSSNAVTTFAMWQTDMYTEKYVTEVVSGLAHAPAAVLEKTALLAWKTPCPS
jgi:hypothetical protein